MGRNSLSKEAYNKRHAEYMRHYRIGNDSLRQKERDRAVRRARELKLKLIQYKGGSCLDCGYNAHPAALHFDHRDPRTKEDNIGNMVHSKSSWERLVIEVDKCDLVCANCHALRTWALEIRP